MLFFGLKHLYLFLMKKRHEQKLIVLAIVLVATFNIPLILLFDSQQSIWGFPAVYFYVFSIWLSSILISYDTVAHELKTPLTSIKASAEILQDDFDEMPAELRNKFMGNIEQEVDRLSRLVNHILDIEKLEHNRAKLILKPTNMLDTIEKVTRNLSQLAKEKNILFEIEDVSSVIALYDEDRIIQVLTNLVSNSIKFSDKPKGKISFSFSQKEDFLEVYIEDNSKGIPENDKNHVFDKFYQSENQNTLKPSGSGLGLAISKQIVQKHGGEIWLEKTNNEGSIFVFSLPFN